MNYITAIVSLTIILTYSNAISLKFKNKLNETFFISCVLIIFFSFLFLKLQFFFNFIIIEYLPYIFIFISILLIPYLKKSFFKIDIKFNLEFIFFFSIIYLLSVDRYYLDQDEITYWGRAVKALFLNYDNSIFVYHPEGLNIFRYLFAIINFNEGITIFSNNLILLCGFFYLFNNRRLKIIEKFVFFLIYYLLFNNLSFGFLSIYSDPILAIFYACLLKNLYFINKNTNLKKNIFSILSLLLILITLLTIKRSSPIFCIYTIFIFLSLLTIRNIKSKKFLYFLLLNILVISVFFYKIYLPIILGNSYDIIEIFKAFKIILTTNSLKFDFINFIFSPIYFSKFGSTFNGIFEIVFSSGFKIQEIDIPLFVYILLILIFIFSKFDNKKFFLISSFFIIIVHAFLIFIFKFYLDGLHVSALPRYLGIIILSKFLFFISVISYEDNFFYKKYSFLTLLFFLIIVTPKKTVGYFVPDKIYYKSLNNKIYKKNRENISILNNKKNNYSDIIIIHKKSYSDYSNNNVSGIHTFYNDIIVYELFPIQPKFVELDNYLKEEKELKDKLKHLLIIIFLNFYELKTNIRIFLYV